MIVVFGAINIDLNMRLRHFPGAGETVLTPSYSWTPGGKGMNQAIAAARAGAKVAMVGCVGDDGFGTRALNALKRDGVLASGVLVVDDMPTGCASVMVDKSGENRIIVAIGANAAAIPEQLPDDILGPGNMLLMQMELDEAVNWEVLKRASELGATTILNLAPARSLPMDALGHLDYLILNRIEAEQIATKLGLKIESDALKLAHVLSKNCGLTCIITLSALGAVAVEGDKGWRVAALDMGDEVVDTTGAGDTYCGVFAACIQQKVPLAEAMKRASVAGSLSVRAAGAQTAMPYMDDIMASIGLLPEAEMVAL